MEHWRHFSTIWYQLHKVTFASGPIFIESTLWARQLSAELRMRQLQRLENDYILWCGNILTISIERLHQPESAISCGGNLLKQQLGYSFVKLLFARPAIISQAQSLWNLKNKFENKFEKQNLLYCIYFCPLSFAF